MVEWSSCYGSHRAADDSFWSIWFQHFKRSECIKVQSQRVGGGGVSYHISDVRIATLIDNRNVFLKAVSQIYTRLMSNEMTVQDFVLFLSVGRIIKQGHGLHPLLLIFYKLLYRHQNQGPLLLNTFHLTLISYIYGKGSWGVDSSLN